MGGSSTDPSLFVGDGVTIRITLDRTGDVDQFDLSSGVEDDASDVLGVDDGRTEHLKIFNLSTSPDLSMAERSDLRPADTGVAD